MAAQAGKRDPARPMQQALLGEPPWAGSIIPCEIPPEQAIASALRLDLVQCQPHPLGDIIRADEKQAASLAYFRNNVLHLLALPALLACLVSHNQRLPRPRARDAIRGIYGLLRTELFLPWEVSNTDGTNLTPITKGLGGANSLLSLSPDGTKALIASSSNYKSKTSTLYLVNLNSLQSEPIQIAQNPWSAKWIDNTRIVYIGQGDQGFGIYVINADGTNTINTEHGNNPVEILAVSKDRVDWNTISTRREGNRSFSTYYAWWTNLDGLKRAN